MKFDELNQLFIAYFDTMEISDDDKQNRVDCAIWLYEAVWFILTMIRLELDSDTLEDEDSYSYSLYLRVRDHLEENDLPYEEDYLNRMVKDIVEKTFRHLDDDDDDDEEEEEEKKAPEKKPEKKENYYLSEKRAIIIAENEANSIYNYVDYKRATDEGKEYKIWVTEGDEKVRTAHSLVDWQKIPIDKKFQVGPDLMRFPHDYVYGSAENLVNCRCSCLYR